MMDADIELAFPYRGDLPEVRDEEEIFIALPFSEDQKCVCDGSNTAPCF